MVSPWLTVVTVVRDDERGIRRTLESLGGQDLSGVEFVVVDGGSKDGTLAALSAARVPIARMKSERDNGIYYAMNKGLRMAMGRFVLFMNAGDEFASPDVLARIRKAIETGPADAVYFGRALVGGRRKIRALPPAGVNVARWLRRKYPNHQAVLYPLGFYRSERYDTRLQTFSDTDYTIRAIESCGYVFVDLPISRFRTGGVSNTYIGWKAGSAKVFEMARLYSRHVRRFGVCEVFRTVCAQFAKYLLANCLRVEFSRVLK
jgi:putative colanic acid biosynthesis glycosyltransferase